MSNGMSDDLRFEQLIKDFSPSEKFLARQLREVQKECEARKTCPAVVVPQFTRKQIVAGTAGMSTIAVAVSVLTQLLIKILERYG